MTTVIEIILVDGVGRPVIRELPEGELPSTYGLARAHVASGPDRIVIFVRTDEMAVEQDGRPLYRQRGVYAAAVRWAYLTRTPIEQPPR